MYTTYLLLKDAILNKKQVLAKYEDDKDFRQMCPHLLGHNEKGEACCLFFQFAGPSSHPVYPITDPRARQNWRCMLLSQLTEVTTREGTWYSLNWHTKDQECVAEVDTKLAGWS